MAGYSAHPEEGHSDDAEQDDDQVHHRGRKYRSSQESSEIFIGFGRKRSGCGERRTGTNAADFDRRIGSHEQYTGNDHGITRRQSSVISTKSSGTHAGFNIHEFAFPFPYQHHLTDRASGMMETGNQDPVGRLAQPDLYSEPGTRSFPLQHRAHFDVTRIGIHQRFDGRHTGDAGVTVHVFEKTDMPFFRLQPYVSGTAKSTLIRSVAWRVVSRVAGVT